MYLYPLLTGSVQRKPKKPVPLLVLARVLEHCMELVSYAAKCVLGGSLVCLFALIAEVCQPKRFAGLFSAAPSVLLAGLAVTLLSQGSATARLTAEGAVVGA